MHDLSSPATRRSQGRLLRVHGAHPSDRGVRRGHGLASSFPSVLRGLFARYLVGARSTVA